MQNSVLALSYNWKNDYYRSNVRDFDGRLSWQKCVMAWMNYKLKHIVLLLFHERSTSPADHWPRACGKLG